MKGRPSKETRNEAILALRGLLSFGLIAKRFGISRNAVAGVCFRADWPATKRVSGKSRSRNKSGTGHHGGGGKPAIVTVWNSPL